jgi:TatD DNase family protein
VKEQARVFVPQLALATEFERPVTIHCLRAWGALSEILRSEPVPARGFLIHAYSGAVEMVAGFARIGAYFSFSPYFLHPRKAAERETFRRVPLERLLVETDAPDMRPPDEQNAHPLRDSRGEPINHPANRATAYQVLADLRGIPLDELAGYVQENYRRLFG